MPNGASRGGWKGFVARLTSWQLVTLVGLLFVLDLFLPGPNPGHRRDLLGCADSVARALEAAPGTAGARAVHEGCDARPAFVSVAGARKFAIYAADNENSVIVSRRRPLFRPTARTARPRRSGAGRRGPRERPKPGFGAEPRSNLDAIDASRVRHVAVHDHGPAHRGRNGCALGSHARWASHLLDRIPAPERGRSVIVCRTPEGTSVDVTPAPFDVRSRVHEYGGGEFTVHRGVIYFTNFDDQRVYRHLLGQQPVPITSSHDLRYADLVVMPGGQRVLAVREDHRIAGAEAVNSLVMLDVDGAGEGRSSLEGATSMPRLPFARTARVWPGWPGIIPICPGMAPSCGWPISSGMARSSILDRSRVVRTRRSSSRNGRPTGCCISCPTEPGGGTSIV